MMRLVAFCAALAVASAWNVETPPEAGWRRVITDIDDMSAEPKWMSPDAVASLVDFVDITDHQDWKISAQPKQSYPSQPTRQAQVNSINALASLQELQDNLEHLESFQNRYYTTFGADSAVWIYDQMNGYIQASGRNDATVSLYPHQGWAQPSVIGRIEGSNQTLPILIVGAHEDSINHGVPNAQKPQARAPGADDDGTGTVSVMEFFRIMLNSNYRPTRSIEFQLYAAEEVGLLGSAAIAQDYASRGVQVHGMFQLDMNGYCATRSRAMIMTQTSVDPALSRFLSMIINEYSDMTNQDTRGSCNSDHCSFTRSGFPAAHCKEAGGYRWIHTADDLSFRMDYGCILEFVKISTGFTIELDG